MNKEIIDEIIEDLQVAENKDLAEILEKCVSYGFLDENSMSKMFDVDLTDVDDLISDTSELTKLQFSTYRKLVIKYLSRERKKYSRLYYKG